MMTICFGRELTPLGLLQHSMRGLTTRLQQKVLKINGLRS